MIAIMIYIIIDYIGFKLSVKMIKSKNHPSKKQSEYLRCTDNNKENNKILGNKVKGFNKALVSTAKNSMLSSYN
jgi:hypothetical protein